MKKSVVILLSLVSAVSLTNCGNNSNHKWWQDTIAYEIYPKSFKDTNNDGVGDLNGITQNLKHLEDLGVGAVWLTPVYASPMKDNGYDVSDYYKVNPLFGSDSDMDNLISEANKHHIKIVMDLVFNHTSDEHQWFIDSVNKRNDKDDWYIWKDPKGYDSDGVPIPPNNWGSNFGGSAWSFNNIRKQFYLHSFGDFQPDLNWENQNVRNALYDIANFWINKGVGGFRIDAVTYIKKPAGFPDGPVPEGSKYCPVNDISMNVPGILDFLNEFKNNVSKGKDIFTVAEANGVKADELKNWVGKNGVFDMLFEFGICNLGCENEKWYKPKPFDITDIKRFMKASEEATTTNEGWYPMFFENHDQPRSINHYFPKASKENYSEIAKGLGTILLTVKGTPFLYQGEEIGCINTEWNSVDEFDDVSTKNQYQEALEYYKDDPNKEEKALECVRMFSRDNARTPMQWSDKKCAGFSECEEKDLWLRLNQDYKTINVLKEENDNNSVLNWYKKLANLRKSDKCLLNGDFNMLLENDKDIFAFTRSEGNSKILVLVNFSNADKTYDIDVNGMNAIANSKDTFTPGTLRAYQSLVLKK